MNKKLDESQLKVYGVFFLIFLLTAAKKNENIFSLSAIDEIKIEKKAQLLNRVKSYMEPTEQQILHRAEIVLQILIKLKSLVQIHKLEGAEVQYTSLGLQDRRRNMLKDLSMYVDEDKREAIHRIIELDVKIKQIEKKVKEIQQFPKTGISIENFEHYIELFEVLLEGDIINKLGGLKKGISALKLLKSVSEKGKINEMDILDLMKPYIDTEQRETLTKIIQIAKAVGSIEQEKNDNQTIIQEENSEELTGNIESSVQNEICFEGMEEIKRQDEGITE